MIRLDSDRQSKTSWAAAIFLLGLLAVCSARAVELKPSFPNHAIVLTPEATPRGVTPKLDDVDIPFTWDQTCVVAEGTTSDRVYRGFDPLFQPIVVNILPATPTFLKVVGFDGNEGLQSVQIFAKEGGNSEVFQFQVTSRGLTSDTANFTYDIRTANSKIRVMPATARSAGDFIKPGQIVKYTWTATTQERFANCEALLTGRTGQAKGLSNSVITRVLGTKTIPMVLGHYLMQVTPRDVRGQPPLGTQGNGLVFRCVFGTDNLPPVTDGFSADTFTPGVNQTVTLQPNATDPETGQTFFSNEFFDFGDGTTAAGISGSTTHAYTAPGVYRLKCTVADNLNAESTAQDTIVVGATVLPRLPFTYIKQIPPEEAGDGLNNTDTVTVSFKDPSGTVVKAGDRIVFAFNRNHFEYVADSPSDTTDTRPIILGAGKTFTGKTVSGAHIAVSATGASVGIKITTAQLDRTGDPRLGRCELKGIFKNQRIALSIIPADGSTPRALVYTGNMQGRVKNGQSGRFVFIPETLITGMSTINEPNPRLQEP